MRPLIASLGVSFLTLTTQWTFPSYGQRVTSDNSTHTIVSNTGSFSITGGTQQLNTLFHSFDDFSPEEANVLFQLAPSQSTVEYVISRVTGAGDSFINSQLSLTGGNSPDLFLINPNGLRFGSNASLLLPGSLFVSTADSVSFQGDVDFSSRNVGAAPLLTISAPVGLQFGTAAQGITLEESYFELQPDALFGVLGGNLQFIGSTLFAENGRLSLGSVAPNSRVGLDASTFQMDYADTANFQDISFTQAAWADVSGNGGGRFQIQGRTVSVLEGSLLEASNTGSTDGGVVSIQASEKIDVSGIFNNLESAIFVDVYGAGQGNHLHLTTDQLLVSQSALVTTDTFGLGTAGDIVTHADDVLISGSSEIDAPSTYLGSTTYGDGQGGDVFITANRVIGENSAGLYADVINAGVNAGSGGDLTLRVDQLVLREGAQFSTGTFGDGHSGNLTVSATDSVDISGVKIISEGLVSSGLFSSAETDSTGDSGSLTITTPRLSIVDGGKVAGNTLGEGNGSNITIRADEIDISESILDFGGAISGLVANVTSEGSGHGGSLDIVTNRLTVRNGGQITTETEGSGNAGFINILANDIEVTGQSSDGLFRSSAITSSSTTPFDAGSITINSDRLSVHEGATMSVSSLNGGNAGNLDIVASHLYLNNGTLQALVTSGSEGNININAERSLLLRQGSQITTSATGHATGGNIVLNAPVIVGIENSDIAANAVFGEGGNIHINTQSLFNIDVRDQLTAESDITASSEFGVSGVIDINNLSGESGIAMRDLSETFVEKSDQLTATCEEAASHNHFMASGRNGLPESPLNPLSNNSTWIDFRGIPMLSVGELMMENQTARLASDRVGRFVASDAVLDSEQLAKQPPLEAVGWSLNRDGQVELLATSPHPTIENPQASCLSEIVSAG